MKKLFAVSLTLTSLLLSACQNDPSMGDLTQEPTQEPTQETQTQETMDTTDTQDTQTQETSDQTQAPVAPATPKKDEPKPTPTPEPDPTPDPAPAPKTVSMTITAAGFSPASVSLNVGDKIVIRNSDDKSHWPASDPHPSHTLCPGFDAGRPLANGESFSFTFTKVAVCTFHDHLNPSTRASVTVTE